ncbi:hypothetical protein D3C75_745710 [compost metagenome]
MKAGRAKLAMAVIATTITMAADTSPASTAACPITSVPTIDTDWPIDFGSLIPASRSTSKVTSIINASIKAGNGMPSRWLIRLISRGVGISSW